MNTEYSFSSSVQDTGISKHGLLKSFTVSMKAGILTRRWVSDLSASPTTFKSVGETD